MNGIKNFWKEWCVKMSVYKKLIEVQNKLKAPKSQYNSFGKYNYRNAEDILEAVKPILENVGATIFIKDSIELIGDRFYVKATVSFVDIESGSVIETSALARESEEKKGMDSAQVTGATSSYARKYALNGLLLIDDTKDNDHDSMHQTDNKEPKKEENKPNYDNKEKEEVIQKIVAKIGNDSERKKKIIDMMKQKYDKTYSDFKYYKLDQLQAVLKAVLEDKI